MFRKIGLAHLEKSGEVRSCGPEIEHGSVNGHYLGHIVCIEQNSGHQNEKEGEKPGQGAWKLHPFQGHDVCNADEDAVDQAPKDEMPAGSVPHAGYQKGGQRG